MKKSETPAGATATSGRMRPHWRIVILLVTLILAGTVVLTLGVRDLTELNDQARATEQDVVRPLEYLEEAEASQRQALNAFATAFTVDDHQLQTAYLTEASTLGERGTQAFDRYQETAVGFDGEREMVEAWESFSEQLTADGQAAALALLNAPSALAPEVQSAFHTYSATFEERLVVLRDLESEYHHRLNAGVGGLESDTRTARNVVLIAFAAALLVCLTAGGITLRAALSQERELAAQDRLREETARRNAFESRLQRALEMRRDEPGAYAVIGDALRQVAPERHAEVLVADSSRAHFRRVLGTDDETGCGVTAPTECPAARAGQTASFPSSSDLDACPFLKNRPSGPCAANCVPLSTTGGAVAVVHVVGPDHTPLDNGQRLDVELVARRAGERIGMVRAFEASEMQAQTDPLTGLLNRRSLENRLRELVADGTSYTVAYSDLDHFKELNDTHGHDTGDRALRLFARVLRDAVRPADLPARFGGEEFVVVLPECAPTDAVTVMERVRQQLRAAVVDGTVPSFTVSVGIADAIGDESFDEVIARADEALLTAKAEGRDRVVTASAGPPEPEPTRRYPAAVDPAETEDVGAPSADVA